jgi:hypothetical protein
MGTTAHCYAVVGGSIPRGCVDYITSAYPNRDPALNNRLLAYQGASNAHVIFRTSKALPSLTPPIFLTIILLGLVIDSDTVSTNAKWMFTSSISATRSIQRTSCFASTCAPHSQWSLSCNPCWCLFSFVRWPFTAFIAGGHASRSRIFLAPSLSLSFWVGQFAI